MRTDSLGKFPRLFLTLAAVILQLGWKEESSRVEVDVDNLEVCVEDYMGPIGAASWPSSG